MSSRETVLGSIRRSLGVTGQEKPRRDGVAERLARHPVGVLPARGQAQGKDRLSLFVAMAEASAASVEVIKLTDAPAAVSAYLRRNNLPARLRLGADPIFNGLDWSATMIETVTGPSDGHDLVALSRAFAGVAETGTLIMTSGAANPTTLNFLPDHHLVLVRAGDLCGDYETVFERLRDVYGHGLMPRTVNWITGPSRSGDIEQKLLFGAHGPRSLHVMVVE